VEKMIEFLFCYFFDQKEEIPHFVSWEISHFEVEDGPFWERIII